MKKQIIIATLALGAIVFGTNNVQAQAGLTDNAQTKVNIILSDVISIDASATEVTFTYDSAAAYNSDQDYDVADNLKVTSTRSFDIAVKAASENFSDGTNNIPVSVLSINPISGGSTNMTGSQTAVSELSTTDQKVISNATLGSELILGINYEILGSKSSSSDILGKPSGTYTQQVIYTATTL